MTTYEHTQKQTITKDKLFLLNRLCREARKELTKANMPFDETSARRQQDLIRKLNAFDDLFQELLTHDGDKLVHYLRSILLFHGCSVPASIEAEL